MSEDKDTLQQIESQSPRVEKTGVLKETGIRSSHSPADYIVGHEEQGVHDVGTVVQQANNRNEPLDIDDEDELQKRTLNSLRLGHQGAEAKRIKCPKCGQIFDNIALANSHAEKTGHEESSEEINSLTEEEMAQRYHELKVESTSPVSKDNIPSQGADSEDDAFESNEAIRQYASETSPYFLSVA